MNRSADQDGAFACFTRFSRIPALPHRSSERKSHALCVSLFLIIVVSLAAPALAQKRNITEKDLFDFVWIGDPQVSPDGSSVAFVRVTSNDKKDGYNTALWIVSTANGQT